MKKILLIILLAFSALLFIGCVDKKDDEIIAHILEVEESKTFDSYDELDSAISTCSSARSPTGAASPSPRAWSRSSRAA